MCSLSCHFDGCNYSVEAVLSLATFSLLWICCHLYLWCSLNTNSYLTKLIMPRILKGAEVGNFIPWCWRTKGPAPKLLGLVNKSFWRRELGTAYAWHCRWMINLTFHVCYINYSRPAIELSVVWLQHFSGKPVWFHSYSLKLFLKIQVNEVQCKSRFVHSVGVRSPIFSFFTCIYFYGWWEAWKSFWSFDA